MTARVLVIAGTGSGVGKTSISIGIARALSRRGVRVRAAKVGPDFLDPMHLTLATGTPCINLDLYMMGEEYVRRLASDAARDADLLLVEGVMGLFDGARPDTSEGSTAEVARVLDAPIVLVADAWGQARSFAATVFGFVHMESGLRFPAVIANQVGSAGHGELLDCALRSMALPPMLAAIPKGGLPSLESRHLGLIAPRSATEVDALATAVEATIPLERLMQLAEPLRGAGPQGAAHEAQASPRTARTSRSLRLAVAEDSAFGFIYADLRQAMLSHGVEWIPFSPLKDPALPPDAEALLLPGGYPEEHAEELSANQPMLQSIAEFAARRPVYAECGGLMALGESLIDRAGRRHAMAGVLPLVTRMGARTARLGYAEVTLRTHTLWGNAGATCRGHEFHYSSLDAEPPDSLERAYEVRYRRGASRHEGFILGRVLASYVHLHLASRPNCLRTLVEEMAR
ncbi:MAG TPA: cobyrinate a,c-diamide synthase [Polyangiaceae bacterium]|nr:cobyrinate a,c-diamide synthase [Polyangiaceae bacterium]